MKKISILIPCYNEEENVGPISEAVVETLVKMLNGEEYDKVINFPEIEVNKDNVLEQADALGYKVQSAK